ELFQQRQYAGFGRQWQGHDQHVDMRNACKFDEFGNRAELGISGDQRWRAAVIAIIEYAADANVVVRLFFYRADQCLGGLATADNDGAPLDAAVARPSPDDICEDEAWSDQNDEPGEEPSGEPDAREVVGNLEEETQDRQ